MCYCIVILLFFFQGIYSADPQGQSDSEESLNRTISPELSTFQAAFLKNFSLPQDGTGVPVGFLSFLEKKEEDQEELAGARVADAKGSAVQRSRSWEKESAPFEILEEVKEGCTFSRSHSDEEIPVVPQQEKKPLIKMRSLKKLEELKHRRRSIVSPHSPPEKSIPVKKIVSDMSDADREKELDDSEKILSTERKLPKNPSLLSRLPGIFALRSRDNTPSHSRDSTPAHHIKSPLISSGLSQKDLPKTSYKKDDSPHKSCPSGIEKRQSSIEEKKLSPGSKRLFRQYDLWTDLYKYVDELEGLTVLMLCAQDGKVHDMHRILSRDASGIDLKSKNKDSVTALMLSVQEDQIKALEVLLDYNANVYIQDAAGKTAVIHAAQGGNLGVIERLLQRDSSGINMQAHNGHTALLAAIIGGHQSVVAELLAHKARADIVDADGSTPLIRALNGDFNMNILYMLMDAWPDGLNYQDKLGRTPVMHAIINENPEVLYVLLSRRPNLEIEDVKSYTPLHYAARKDYKYVVALFDKGRLGSSITALTNSNLTPLALATLRNDGASVALIASYIQDDDVYKVGTDDHCERNNALMFAAERGCEDIVKILLERSPCGINNLNKYRKSALIIAAENGHPKIVELLLRYSPNINLSDSLHLTARQYALIKRAMHERLGSLEKSKKYDQIQEMISDYEAIVLAEQYKKEIDA